MGGRGSSSGMSVNGRPYGSEYHTVLQVGNIKFLMQNDTKRSTTAPMETMTSERIYVTISHDTNKPKFITFYDEEKRRFKQIDLSGKTHYVGKERLHPPHMHLGYLHDENGTRRLSDSEKGLVDNVLKIWDTHNSK